MSLNITCDGVRRRDFLKVGVLGATGLTFGSFLRMSHGAPQVPGAKAKAAIFINLPGGPTHMDTFDLKPNAPDTHRGEFKPIQTKVSGIEICEHLPLLASTMDKFTILRGVSHSIAAHQLGSEYVNTGNRPLPSLEFPGFAAVASKELGGPRDLPNSVAIPNSAQKAGYLGVQYSPLNTGKTPVQGQSFNVRGIALGNGLTIEDVEKRQGLLKQLDTAFAGYEKNSQLLEGLDRFSQQAYEMITSPRARAAFDISKEKPEVSEKFGKSGFGQSCLLATRLVESGVRFVTISTGGWDTHNDNWNRLKTNLLPPIDQGLSSLLTALSDRGLLETTTVYVTGEFGRTPKINKTAGRDHYPRAMFQLMAGGGIKGGQVLGASDDKGEFPADGKGYSPDNIAASFYHTLGIDHTKEYHTSSGRPVMIVREGQIIPELFA
ncbi:DUF1501 domain-containing protein [Planctomyces sp. SH-PL14]|uniref:DUF1501 domain-containing protein n=1 Tax=Planctomyces sp. SH-PL14 TaxID=1632864 RepID=UPI00078C20B9|nr:DUF1501 domain-containing protein [Planctomyces sp. SH-PL14]AMV17269.1 hypothetical protein VT03_05215 [Planctomyces sp. SH-PL14]